MNGNGSYYFRTGSVADVSDILDQSILLRCLSGSLSPVTRMTMMTWSAVTLNWRRLAGWLSPLVHLTRQATRRSKPEVIFLCHWSSLTLLGLDTSLGRHCLPESLSSWPPSSISFPLVVPDTLDRLHPNVMYRKHVSNLEASPHRNIIGEYWTFLLLFFGTFFFISSCAGGPLWESSMTWAIREAELISGSDSVSEGLLLVHAFRGGAHRPLRVEHLGRRWLPWQLHWTHRVSADEEPGDTSVGHFVVFLESFSLSDVDPLLVNCFLSP